MIVKDNNPALSLESEQTLLWSRDESLNADLKTVSIMVGAAGLILSLKLYLMLHVREYGFPFKKCLA